MKSTFTLFLSLQLITMSFGSCPVLERNNNISQVKIEGRDETTEKPSFSSWTLWDTEGNPVDISQISGKVIFLDFWFTGCPACVGFYHNRLKPIKERFLDHPDFLYISISIDESPEKWCKSIASGKYTDDRALNLYTGTLGVSHQIIEDLEVSHYPFVVIKDQREGIYTDKGLNKRADLLESAVEALLSGEALPEGFVDPKPLNQFLKQ